MRALGGLVHEEVLDHQEIELADRLLGVVQVGLGEQGILAHDVHRARLPGEGPLDYLGDDAARPCRRLRPPRRLELRERLGDVVLVAR